MPSITVLAVVAVAGAATSAVGQREAGIAAHDDATMRARQSGLDAGQKLIQSRQNMLKAMASQNAAAGQGGVGTGGSIGANVNRQITQNQSDLLALNANASAEEQQYTAQGQNALAAGNIAAGGSLLDAVGAGAKGVVNYQASQPPPNTGQPPPNTGASFLD